MGTNGKEEEYTLLYGINGNAVRKEGGEMGYSTEAVAEVVGGGGWGRPLWQGEQRRKDREGGMLVKPRVFMRAASVFFFALW